MEVFTYISCMDTAYVRENPPPKWPYTEILGEVLTPVCREGYLKLIDFGIAKKLEEGKTRTFTMKLSANSHMIFSPRISGT